MKTDVSLHSEGLLATHQEHIPQAYIDELADYRNRQSAQRCRNYHRVASIPSIFVAQFAKEGFDVYKETPSAVISYLKRKGLEAFITTDKSV